MSTHNPTKILITGGKGQLAQALSHHPDAARFQLILLSREALDITDGRHTEETIRTHSPHIVINTAAYTAVDQAETAHDEAHAINQGGADHIARACHTHGIPLIHLSTDYLFDGMKNTPYCEDDPVNPLNQYGKSKWLGEEAVRKHCLEHIILRVSGLFGEYGHNFFKTLLNLQQQSKPIRIVKDQITCPTYTGDIAGAIFAIIKHGRYDGTYHFCSTPPVSWHEFAEAALMHRVEAITSSEIERPALRPMYSCLDCSKITATFGIKQPSWKQALEKLR